ncbi:uncharacterized protein LOC119108689 [Pollicipes pollicipes]|nr:uncharacterized protein LOC119108689 [Pollicipes pollicipes]
MAELPPPLVILGDFSAHHTVWGCDDSNARKASALARRTIREAKRVSWM